MKHFFIILVCTLVFWFAMTLLVEDTFVRYNLPSAVVRFFTCRLP